MRQALEMALEALEEPKEHIAKHRRLEAITAIKEALAQPEQEPVATIAVRWHEPVGKVAFVLEVDLPVGIHKVYTTPPQRTWVGLTDEEMRELWDNKGWYVTMFKAVEAKLKEKNT